MIYMVEFGNKLRKAREEKGITQQTLAEKLFVTRQTVSNWECGKRYPDLITTKRISQILEVGLDDLLSEKEMTKEVERKYAVCNGTANGIMLALYTVVILFALKKPVDNFMGFYTETIRFIQEAKMLLLFFDIGRVAMILRMVIFLYCMICVLRGTLTSKRIGIGWSVFFIINTLVFCCNFFSVFYDCFSVQVAGITVADILLNVIGAVSSVLFFVKGKNFKALPIILISVSILGFYGDVVLYLLHNIKLSRIMPVDGIRVLGPLDMFITILFRLPVYILIVYQVMIEQKMRKERI